MHSLRVVLVSRGSLVASYTTNNNPRNMETLTSQAKHGVTQEFWDGLVVVLVFPISNETVSVINRNDLEKGKW